MDTGFRTRSCSNKKPEPVSDEVPENRAPDMALLEVENLQTHFRTPDGVNRAVDGVSFEVAAGETLAIVGESGCGKSVTAMSILRLIPEPPGKIAGAIRFQGKDLLKLSEPEMRSIRG